LYYAEALVNNPRQKEKMGKGDRKSKKGKICRGSYGKTRKHQIKKIEEKKK